MADLVMTQMQATAALCYDANSYPYFFNDNNPLNGGPCDAAEASFGNRFQGWTGPLMKAAHNFQIFQKDPGSWAHNFDYMAQLLYDSVEDLGGNPAGAGLIRPAP